MLNENELKDYAEWLADPRTKKFIDFVDKLIRPVAVDPKVGNFEYRYAYLAGKEAALTILANLDKIDKPEAPEADADYGKDNIIKAWEK